MRVAIHTLGTRGDIQPYLALALGLIARGHDVQLTAPVQFEAMIRERGVAFSPLPGEFLALLDKPEGKAAIAGGKGFSGGFKLLKHIRPLMRHLLDAEWSATKEFAPDIIVYHPKALGVPHIAEKLGCRFILASPLPGFTPTSAFPTPLLPFASLGPLNRISHGLAIKGMNVLFGGLLRDWRKTTLGLPPRSTGKTTPSGTLYAYSPHVVPVPPDWGRDVLVSGYWFLDHDDWHPPEDLAAFLKAGEPPVYIGFGSMPGLDPVSTAATVIEALTKTGKRGVLATGGGALAPQTIPPNIHVIREAPHDKLFPHVGATVHHGGAGTTAASLRAGKPMTICPFLGDQPFWARRMWDLGVAPPPLDRKHLSVETLAAAIADMENPQMRERAATRGAAIRQEHGVTAAIDFIEAHAARKQSA
ncbi:glycosyltransferase [Pseudorhodoplanes sinuspersici]|uniref:Glycosyl transferase n=1 Tax=Pseudorhodoplanes sinuspersici TaxID=1235591 RepID=A0A1W6ZNF1_9HYPH|nr:glycosyltransferase [Pseudorhodoplanes sinuspersici]ARP98889.1 glycosyl transferase [Pseudorhodoplanes sinuspersici]RKE69487.1 UDP:flavonoid glycosyltransferase YjiC (YdhE family) [Pseudorhodoplanes sinuspersici]